MFRLSWSIEGETELSRRLEIIESRVKNWEPAFKDTAIALRDIFSNDVFQTRGAVINEHWAPLSRAYALRKEKKFPGKGILEATGEMKNSFQTFWSPTMAKVWNDVEYFKYHQSNQPRSVLPRRVVMKLANQQRDIVVKIFHNYFYAATK